MLLNNNATMTFEVKQNSKLINCSLFINNLKQIGL